MSSNRTRLDRFLSIQLGVNKKDVRLILAKGRVLVDGVLAREINQVINAFSLIEIDGQPLQQKQARYIMLNKPRGVVSATRDSEHKTATALLGNDVVHDLHIAGRLDLNSTGLLLLTNDGRWSKRLSCPDGNIAKLYEVTVANAITEDYIEAFAGGMYFPYEDITTKPAKLEIIGEKTARVTLVEGRYHQIKRMFGRFRNPVLRIHRVSIGGIHLDRRLSSGDNRPLTDDEVASVGNFAR